jgi:hypothetical protein
MISGSPLLPGIALVDPLVVPLECVGEPVVRAAVGAWVYTWTTELSRRGRRESPGPSDPRPGPRERR